MDDMTLQNEIAKYRWYHIIPLTDEISTPGSLSYVPQQKLTLRFLDEIDFHGKRVLDIGCRDGLFSFAAEKAGASEILGIDNDLSRGANEFLIPFFNSKVRMQELNLYNLHESSIGKFDVIIFPGVLYHLRYPFWGLKKIRDVLEPGGTLLIETAVWPREPNNAMLFCPTGTESPYEDTSCTFFNRKGLEDSLISMGFHVENFEYVKKEGLARLAEIARYIVDIGRNGMKKGYAPIVRGRVKRAVLRAVYSGKEMDSNANKYWDSTHDLHSATRHSGTRDCTSP